jgi:phenylacetate-CoA ligase
MTQPATVTHGSKSETLDRDELAQLQIERLQSTLNRAYRNVAFYRAAFDEHHVDIESVKDLASIRQLPFTTREDLRKAYPYGMFAVPLRDIVRIHATTGTTGEPIVVGYTRNDLRHWSQCAARLLSAAGITEQDVVQIALEFGLGSAASGFQQGAEQIGASVIPASAASSLRKQITIMRDFKTTVLACTPGHATSLAIARDQLQVHPERLHVRLGLLTGERFSAQRRSQIEQQLRISTIDMYGLTEVMAPGIAGECHLRNGLHINEDHLIAEVIDPTTLSPLPPGERGELVLTTITKEGFPLIRYRTGDLTSLDVSPCGCGRALARMERIAGRTDDMICFRGISFFPAQIERALAAVEGASPHYRIILDREEGLDTLEVRVEVSEAAPLLDEVRALESLRLQLARQIKAELDVEAKISFAQPRSLSQPSEGPNRIIDNRAW